MAMGQTPLDLPDIFLGGKLGSALSLRESPGRDRDRDPHKGRLQLRTQEQTGSQENGVPGLFRLLCRSHAPGLAALASAALLDHESC